MWRRRCFHGINAMILCRQIFDVTANENARYKRNELEWCLFRLISARIEFWFYHIYSTLSTLYLTIFDWNLRSRKHRTNADLIGAISPKKPFSSIMRYMVLWRHLWRYRINANIKTWYTQKPHILTFTLIPSSFFSDHCVKLYRWMCITFQMPLVFLFMSNFRWLLLLPLFCI